MQGLSPLNGDTSTLSECSLSDEGSLSENLSCGGGKMKSKLSTKPGKDDKICAVCGDKALGCNFDAISCESCKAFFRRNAMKEAVCLSLHILTIFLPYMHPLHTLMYAFMLVAYWNTLPVCVLICMKKILLKYDCVCEFYVIKFRKVALYKRLNCIRLRYNVTMQCYSYISIWLCMLYASCIRYYK